MGKRAYKVKGLTERGAAQMTFLNKCDRLMAHIVGPTLRDQKAVKKSFCIARSRWLPASEAER